LICVGEFGYTVELELVVLVGWFVTGKLSGCGSGENLAILGTRNHEVSASLKRKAAVFACEIVYHF
jgi:hypothetical protein